jgi:hypothetical protein
MTAANQHSTEPFTKRFLIYQELEKQPRNPQGNIEWSKNVLARLQNVLDGEANVIQTILYDMEKKGHINRERDASGRYVKYITLVNPPTKNVVPINGGAAAAPKPVTDFKPGQMYAEIVTITPEMAAQWLDLNSHNRGLRQQFIERLAAAIKRGEWITNGETIKVNKKSLVDGQHRLWAIVLAEKPVKALVAYNVPDSAQETVDTGIKRTMSDMLKLRGEKDHTTLAAALVQLHIWETRGALGLQGAYYPTPQQAFALLNKYPEIRESVDIGRRLSAHIHYPGGLAATLHWVLNKIDSEDATDFFDRLTSGHNLDEDNPILVLRDSIINYGPMSNGDKMKLAALLIKAWNFYRGGHEVKRLIWKAGGAKPEAFPKPI